VTGKPNHGNSTGASRYAAIRPGRPRLRAALVVALGALTLLGHLLVHARNGVAAVPAGQVDGASHATCNPSPCTPATPIAYTLVNVPNGDGTYSQRTFAVQRPVHLTASAANLAPAVLVFYPSGNCGLVPSSRFASLAPTDRFVVVYMEVPCSRNPGGWNWEKRYVNTATSSIQNDEPYVTAVVNAITQCPGGQDAADQCVDPQRIYAAGTSSGGNMAADIMCDPQNSRLFRGYLIDSSSLQLFNGRPNCPSPDRDYLVMLAVGNAGLDAGLYYDTAAHPHLDVPAFADWAAARLGCAGTRVDDAIGSPAASTLRYTYDAPCAQLPGGSPAVVSLGIQNGAHTWGCQDSDPLAPPHSCSDLSGPPGLGPNGKPQTNGLFLEQAFWSFVVAGVTSPQPPSGAGTAASSHTRWTAIGDGFASGAGNPPYLRGTNTRSNRCRRSTAAYPVIAQRALAKLAPRPNFRACDGASLAALERSTGASWRVLWTGSSDRVDTVTIGWADAGMASTIRSCGQAPASCTRRYSHPIATALKRLGSRSPANGGSLYGLYRQMKAQAPHAQVLAVGYPALFASAPSGICAPNGSGLRLTPGVMRWLDHEIASLDHTIQAAASAAHVGYAAGVQNAFAGHAMCQAGSLVNRALYPTPAGASAIAKLVVNAIRHPH